MKGRGVRVIDPDALQSVTPDAEAKTHFVIVDAVGVSEQDKTATKPLDRKPSVPLDKILDLVAAGRGRRRPRLDARGPPRPPRPATDRRAAPAGHPAGGRHGPRTP